jgi:hypothetical protein
MSARLIPKSYVVLESFQFPQGLALAVVLDHRDIPESIDLCLYHHHTIVQRLILALFVREEKELRERFHMREIVIRFCLYYQVAVFLVLTAAVYDLPHCENQFRSD